MSTPADPPRLPGTPVGPRLAVVTLAVLTLLNFLNYVDRFVLAAVLEKLRHDPGFAGVSDARFGLLQTAFVVVYMLLSPAAGVLGRRVPRTWLIAGGVGLWSLATVGSGLSRNYTEMLLSRALIGCGEAGYATVAPAMIGDLFSRDRRSRVLAIFYLATPVGSALGFMLGGAMAEHYSWRAAFFVAGGPGLVLALLALLLPDPPRGLRDDALVTGTRRPLRDELRELLRNGAYLRTTAGTTLMTFTLGGLAFWVPTYLQEVRHMSVGSANLVFGQIAVVSGIVGTLAGGFLGDAWARRDPNGYFRLSGLGLLIATPFAFAVPFVGSLTLTLVFTFVGELFVFLNTGPLNTALINASPPTIREAAVGLNVLCIHLLGDAISPPLLGAMIDVLSPLVGRPRALDWAIASTALPLLLAGVVLLVGLGRPVDRPTGQPTVPAGDEPR